MHNEGARLNKGRFSETFSGINHWVRKRLPTPGAQNYAYESLGLAEFSYAGRATANKHSYRVVQTPQLYVDGQSLLTSGLGGVAAGQIISQPLIDPYNQNYAGQ